MGPVSLGISNGTLEFRLGEAWHRLPSAGDDVSAGLAAVAAAVSPGTGEPEQRLEYGLRAVTTLALGLPPGMRISHALVLRPETGTVDALLSVRLSITVPEGYDNYVRAARAVVGTEETELIRRTVDELQIPGARAVASRDFTLPRQREGIPAPAMERAFLAVFPHEAETVVEFSLFTQNLALFDDPTEFLIGLASGRIDDEESP